MFNFAACRSGFFKLALITLLLTLPIAGFAQSRLPVDSGRDPQLERLNRSNIEQRRAIESSRNARANQILQQDRLRALNERRREDLRERLDSVQESLRDRQNYNLDTHRQRLETIRNQQRINRLEDARDLTNSRTSTNSSVRREQRARAQAEQQRNIQQQRSERRATTNRFLNQRYFRSRQQQGR